MVVLYLLITPFEFILSAIPVAVLFIVVLVYIISAYWREDARARVKEFSSSLRESQHTLNLSEKRQRTFSQVREQDPFLNPYENALSSLNSCKIALKEQYQRYSELQQEIADQMINSPKNMVMAPYLWFETRRKQQRFERDLNHHEHLKQELENALCELENIGRKTATEAQNAWQQVQELGNILQTLSQRQIHGENFTRVRERYAYIHSHLSQLPAHFLNFDRENASEEFGNHTEVVKVASVLNQHASELGALYHDCQNWEAQHNLVHEQLHQLGERQQEIASRLGLLPIGIDSTPLLQTLNECRVQIRNIRERARRTEADDLRYLLRETRQTARVLDTLLNEINQLIKVFDGYQQTRSQLDAEWLQLKNLAFRLSQSPFLPIQLDQTAVILNTIHKDVNGLPPLNTPMTPETLRNSFSNAQTLLKTCQKYAPEIEVLQNNHAELLVILKHLKTDEIIRWADEVQKNHQLTSRYHLNNYYLTPALVNLDVLADITLIKDLASQLPNLNANIKESTILQILGQARDMETRRKLLDEGIRNQIQQYHTLLDAERSSREKITSLMNAIEQLDTLMLEDPYLQQKAARSIRVYDKKLESLQRVFDRPQESTLQKKSAELDTLEEQIQKDLRIWQEDFLRREREGKKNLSGALEHLAQMATLDEPVLQEAAVILQDFQNKRPSSEMAVDGYTISEQAQQLVDSHLQQQDSMNTMAEIETLHHEIKLASEELDHALYRCNQQIESAARWIDPSGWNQRALSFDRLRKEVEAVQNAIQKLRQTKTNVRNFVQQANLLSRRLSETENRIEQIVAEGEQERKAVQDAESAMEATINLWRKLADTHMNDRNLRFGVQEMLQLYQQQYSQERKKFERGNLPLEGYLRSLKQIDRRLNAEIVSSEEGKQVDITGTALAR